MARLHWDTTRPVLQTALKKLMEAEPFVPFRLVGGTALSLQLGHRMSDDIDLFTDYTYDSIDFNPIDAYLRDQFPYVSPRTPGPTAMGISYMIGVNDREAVKLDLYYTDTFVNPPIVEEGIRMASVDEITAMKIDIVQRTARKKDFFDLHEILGHRTINAMIELHKKRYPYNHLRGKHWEVIKWDFTEMFG